MWYTVLGFHKRPQWGGLAAWNSCRLSRAMALILCSGTVFSPSRNLFRRFQIIEEMIANSSKQSFLAQQACKISMKLEQNLVCLDSQAKWTDQISSNTGQDQRAWRVVSCSIPQAGQTGSHCTFRLTKFTREGRAFSPARQIKILTLFGTFRFQIVFHICLDWEISDEPGISLASKFERSLYPVLTEYSPLAVKGQKILWGFLSFHGRYSMLINVGRMKGSRAKGPNNIIWQNM